jgi:hypothetical protein
MSGAIVPDTPKELLKRRFILVDFTLLKLLYLMSNKETMYNKFASYRKPFVKRIASKEFTPEEVFGAAVAAQELNKSYIKVPVYSTPDADGNYKIVNKPNKEEMRDILMNKTMTPEQIEQGKVVRFHYQGLLLRLVGNQINDFQTTALKVASKEMFNDVDNYDLAVIASLPSCYARDLANETVTELAKGSKHIGTVGSKVMGEFEIVKSIFSMKWQSWIINAKMGNDMFFFFFREDLGTGSKKFLSAQVKGHGDDNVTKLGRVKIIK